MASVSPPLHDVLGPGHALMEVMKQIAVYFSINVNALHVCSTNYTNNLFSHFLIHTHLLNQLLQFSAQVEHFGAPMASVSALLIAVMGHETAQMAVMSLDVVVSSDRFLNCR